MSKPNPAPALETVPIIDHTHQVAKPEAVTSTALTATMRLVKTYYDGFETYLSALDKWAEFAIEVENSDQTSQISRRLEFNFKQKCQQLWIQLYGNRTMEQIKSNQLGDSRTSRFSAKENVNYWESQWFGTTVEREEEEPGGHQVIEGHNSVTSNATYLRGICNEPDGMFGPSFKKANTMVRLEEAKLNYNMVLAEYNMYNEMYGLITGAAFVYQTYSENNKPIDAPSKSNMSLAAKIMANRQEDYQKQLKETPTLIKKTA